MGLEITPKESAKIITNLLGKGADSKEFNRWYRKIIQKAKDDEIPYVKKGREYYFDKNDINRVAMEEKQQRTQQVTLEEVLGECEKKFNNKMHETDDTMEKDKLYELIRLHEYFHITLEDTIRVIKQCIHK